MSTGRIAARTCLRCFLGGLPCNGKAPGLTSATDEEFGYQKLATRLQAIKTMMSMKLVSSEQLNDWFDQDGASPYVLSSGVALLTSQQVSFTSR